MKQTVRFRYAREKEYHDATQHFVSASWHFSHQTQYIVYDLKINLFPLHVGWLAPRFISFFHSLFLPHLALLFHPYLSSNFSATVLQRYRKNSVTATASQQPPRRHPAGPGPPRTEQRSIPGGWWRSRTVPPPGPRRWPQSCPHRRPCWRL